MTQAQNEKLINEIKEKVKGIRNYRPKVGIFGVTGVGKSSLCNALFGKDIAPISDVAACTREPKEVLIGDEKTGITIVDVPGVGETPERDEEYFALYKSLVSELDLVIWAIKSDDRAYSVALKAYNEILLPAQEKCPTIFVVTQVDKIEPLFDWDMSTNQPGSQKAANIDKKIIEVSTAFDVSAQNIAVVSANQKYNLIELMDKVVEVLPNEKKFAFTREANEEYVSQDAALEAERGILDYIKDFCGDAYDAVKDNVIDVVVETATKAAKSVIKNGIKYGAKLLKALF
ncbi:GTPase family protein [Vibrio penaeicida]|uniref:GTPase family protein n=1 Tax=Vibrio penaeicida TaxID=104609 RepID=UPI000CEA273E|nr:GTPase [Vibrio penaeicida]